MKKAPITLTPNAVQHISRLMKLHHAQGLRLGIKKGGCAGMEYTMDFVQEFDPSDEVVHQDGACVAIAPLAQMFLIGTTVDYKSGLLESGFSFHNPNVAESCGCGESIKFKEVNALEQPHNPTT